MLTLILGLGNIGKKYRKTRHNLGFEVVDRVVEKLGAVRQADAGLFEWWRVEVGGGDARRAQESPFDSAQGVVADRDDTANEDVRRAQEASGEDGRRAQESPFDSAQGDLDSGAEKDQERLLRHDPSFRGAQDRVIPRNDDAGEGRGTKREVILAKPRTFMNGSGEAAKELIERLEITPAEILVIVDDFQLPLGAVRFRQNGSDGGHNGLISVIEELGTQAFPRLRLGIGMPADKAQVVDYVLSRFTTPEKPAVEKMLAVAAEGVIFATQHRLEVVMSKYNFNPAPPDLA
jgi:PTH1 family peptidyl-tRNA hydrolase